MHKGPDFTLVDPALWDVPMLIHMQTDLRAEAKHSPDGPWFEFSSGQNAILLWSVVTMTTAIKAKESRGLSALDPENPVRIVLN
jgi:hypothetical protein